MSFKKSLKRGQSVIEFAILVVTIVAVTLLSTGVFVPKFMDTMYGDSVTGKGMFHTIIGSPGVSGGITGACGVVTPIWEETW